MFIRSTSESTGPNVKMQLSSHLPLLIVCLASFLERSFAQSEGDLRLVNGTTNYGRLEIYYNSTWSTISNKSVGYQTPRVACRQLGLPFTEAEFVRDKSIFLPADSETVLVTRIRCDGDEVRLTNCPNFDWKLVQFYTHEEDLTIICKGEIIPYGEIRLVDGSDRLRGRLEIYTGTTRYGWLPFCDIGFGVNEAAVACRQLGLNTSEPYLYGYTYLSSDVRYESEYTVHCTGDEENITSCDKLYLSHLSNDSNERECNYYYDALSICCSMKTGICEPPPPSTAEIAGGAISVIIIILAICGGCYITCRGRCKKKFKPPKQYNAVPQTADGADPSNQFPMAPVGDSELPVYIHGHTTAEASVPSASVAQSHPAQQTTYPSSQPSGMPPTAAPASNTTYPPQPYPYPSGQVPPPTGAYSVPHQPGYNPTAAANQYPPQPAAPHPPQTSSMAPPYVVPYHSTGPPTV